MIFHHGRKGQIYNIGGRNEWQNIDIARLMCRFLDSKAPRTEGKNYAEQIWFVQDRQGHDMRYPIDASKIETELGWQGRESFESGMDKMVDWYLAKVK